MLGRQASHFLIPAQKYVDIKFNEKAIITGVKEENPFALRLYHEVFDSKIEQKKTSRKTDMKMKMKIMCRKRKTNMTHQNCKKYFKYDSRKTRRVSRLLR